MEPTTVKPTSGNGSAVTVALDAMSGDLGADTLVQAAIASVQNSDDVNVILVGDESVLTPLIKKAPSDRLSVHHASEVVTMEESACLLYTSPSPRD